MNSVLQSKNDHPRDKNVEFFEEGHTYAVVFEPDKIYTSVTTWVHKHFPEFDEDATIRTIMNSKGWKYGHRYWGLNNEQIKDLWNANRIASANAGTALHYKIECFMNEKLLPEGYTHNELYNLYMCHYGLRHRTKSLEWKYFINFVKDHPHLVPFRTEWVIYHEDVKISGCVDMVYENSDGTLSIYDWKRSKNISRTNLWNKFAFHYQICHLPDSNFWYYAMQLNTYRVILEDKYGKKVKDLYLVQLHPSLKEGNYRLIPMPDLSYEVRSMFQDIKQGINKV